MEDTAGRQEDQQDDHTDARKRSAVQNSLRLPDLPADQAMLIRTVMVCLAYDVSGRSEQNKDHDDACDQGCGTFCFDQSSPPPFPMQPARPLCALRRRVRFVLA